MPGRPSRAVSSSTLNVSGFRSILWSNLETVLDLIFSTVCEMMQLQKILSKKRDLMGNSFFDLLDDNQRQVVQLVWNQVRVHSLMTSRHQGALSRNLGPFLTGRESQLLVTSFIDGSSPIPVSTVV